MDLFGHDDMFWDECLDTYFLDLDKATTVAKLKTLTSKISIAFYIPTRREISHKPIQLWSIFWAEGLRCPYDHCEIWLGDKVAVGTMGVNRGSLQDIPLNTREYNGAYDVIQISDMNCKPEVIDILVKMCNTHAKYHARIWHFLIA